jgi:CBS domain-containing protein
MTTPDRETGDREIRSPVPGIRDVMTSPVVTARASTTLDDVVRLMLDRRVGCVVITDDAGRTPLGIVTETDFQVADDTVPLSVFHWPTVLGRFVWSDESLQEVYARVRTEPAASVMSTPVFTIQEDAHVWEAAELMAKNGIRRVPVVRDGRLVGIVTTRDLLKFVLCGPDRP